MYTLAYSWSGDRSEMGLPGKHFFKKPFEAILTKRNLIGHSVDDLLTINFSFFDNKTGNTYVSPEEQEEN